MTTMLVASIALLAIAVAVRSAPTFALAFRCWKQAVREERVRKQDEEDAKILAAVQDSRDMLRRAGIGDMEDGRIGYEEGRRLLTYYRQPVSLGRSK